MNIGCCRVFTEDQHPDFQLTALKRAGCRTIFTDKATGAHVKRPALEKCLQTLHAGDVLVVWKLDRLGRSLRDLIGLLDDLKTRGGVFRSLTEAIDTATPTGRAMWHMIGILAELERSLLQERPKQAEQRRWPVTCNWAGSPNSRRNTWPMPARCSTRGNALPTSPNSSRCHGARWKGLCADASLSTPPATLECMANICLCNMAVLLGPATRVMGA